MRVDVIDGTATFETNTSSNGVTAIPVPKRGFIKELNIYVTSGSLAVPIRVVTSRLAAGNTVRIARPGTPATLSTNTPDVTATNAEMLAISTVLSLTSDNTTTSGSSIVYHSDGLGAAYACDIDSYQRSDYLYLVSNAASTAEIHYRFYIAVDREVTV